jgi:ArsR family transcriptional regulator
MRQAIKVFKALSDRTRLRILKMLEIKPLCVCEITEVLQLANSTVSRHLSILRDAELIIDEKEGKWVIYQLKTIKPSVYVDQIKPILELWLSTDETVVTDQERVRTVDRKVLCGS